jgi:hypothetical protein
MNKNKNSFNPELWGSSGWIFLQHVALSYPSNPTNEDKQNYKRFFLSLENILPCQSCSDNFRKHIGKIPINSYLKNNHTLFNWIVQIHNEVNKLQNKKLIDDVKLRNLYINNNNYHPFFMFFNNNKMRSIFYFIVAISILFIIKKLKLINYIK